MGVVTEHFRVWLEKYFLQSLEAMNVKIYGQMSRKKTHPISLVECFGHNVQIICNEAIKTKET